MVRCLPLLAMVLLSVPRGAAQQSPSIHWSRQPEQSVTRARQTKRPLMFWILGRSASRDDRLERAQKRAFRDPLVVGLASRFETVRLSRSRHRDLLAQWSLSPRANLEIVFATPAGDKIDTLSPQGAADADTLARKMTLVFRHYRKQMFTQEIKPKLEGEKVKDEELPAALKLVEEFLILSADRSVIALLERESLSPGTRKAVYGTLAVLSTPASVETLLEHAGEDGQAAAALARCTPDAAERMLAELESEDPELRLAVYHAVTQICKLRNVKPDRFWEGHIAALKRDEIERVRRLVSAAAERWRKRYAEHR